MDGGARYAIYFAPVDKDPLWRFGCETLGYDAAAGVPCRLKPPDGFSEDEWRASTQAPRLYGFHATLKAPFHLAQGCDEAALLEAFRRFGERQASVDLAGLEASALGRFVALVPRGRADGLQELAEAAVRSFEPFRAPLSADDLARRLEAPLSPAQERLLRLWGYPYVLDEFRFHMTLTGALQARDLDRARDALAQGYSTATGDGGLAIEQVALFRQPSRAEPFRLVARTPLAGTRSP